MPKSRLQMLNEQYAPDSPDVLPVPEGSNSFDPGYTIPEEQPQDTPPSNDRATQIARQKFEAFVKGSGSDYSNRGATPLPDLSWVGQAAGQAAANTPGVRQFQDVWNNPTLQEGIKASSENTAGGLGVISNAVNEARRNAIENPDYAKQTLPGVNPYANRQAGSGSIIQKYFEDQKVKEQSNNFRSHVADIARQTGQDPTDPRVIFEAARAQRGEQGTPLDAIAEGLVDPTNLPFAVLGGGAAARKLAQGAGQVLEHGKQVSGILGETLTSPLVAAADEFGSHARPLSATPKEDAISAQQRWMEQQRRLQGDQSAVDNEARLRGEEIRRQEEEAMKGHTAPQVQPTRGGALRGEPAPIPQTDAERARAARRDLILKTLQDQKDPNSAFPNPFKRDPEVTDDWNRIKQDLQAKADARQNVYDATKRGELPPVYGMADIRPSTIGASEKPVLDKLWERYLESHDPHAQENGQVEVGRFRGGPARVQFTGHDMASPDAIAETYATTPPFIRFSKGMTREEFDRTMIHELEHAGQDMAGAEGGMNAIDAERAAYGITGEVPPPIAQNMSGEFAAKLQAQKDVERVNKWRNTLGTSASSTSPEAQRQLMISQLQPKGSTFPDRARGLSNPPEPMSAVPKDDAKTQIENILENMKSSSNAANRTMATNIEKVLAEGGTPEKVLQDLQDAAGAFGMKGTPADSLAEVQRQKDLARARSIAEKIVNHPGATEADKIAAQEEVARLSGKPAKPGTGGALTPEVVAGPKPPAPPRFDPTTGKYTDAAFQDWLDSLPPNERAAADQSIRDGKSIDTTARTIGPSLGSGKVKEWPSPESVNKFVDDIVGPPKYDPAMEAKLNEPQPKLTQQQIDEAKAPIRGDEVLPGEGNGKPLSAVPKDMQGKSKEEIAAALEKTFGKRPRGEQTVFDQSFGTGKVKETPIGTNLPTPVTKSEGRKMPGTQPFVDAQSKAKMKFIPGDMQQAGVADVHQAMIDAGVAQKGFSAVSPKDIGNMGINALSWAARAPRELLVSADISMSLRQGGIAAISHPKEWAAAMRDELGAAWSEGGLDAAEQRIKQMPSYNFAQSVGLRNEIGQAGVAKGTGSRFEGYTNAIPRDTPVVGGVVRASERASEAFLASVRTRIFDNYAKSWGLMDMESLATMTPKQIANRRRDAEQLASFINSITGSGDLGALEQFAEPLNKLFFSPRFFASRINNLFSPIVFGAQAAMGQSSWKMAGLAARDMLQFYGITIGTLTAASQIPGVSVGMDPAKAGFGQIRVGDHVIDITGGMARTLGEIGRLKDRSQNEPAFGESTGREELANFLFGKFNPPISNAGDLISANRDIAGNPRGVTGHIPIPLDLQNIAQAALNDFNKNGTAGALEGGTLAALEVLGLGVQTYPEKRSKQPTVSQNPLDIGLSNLTGIGQAPPQKRKVGF